MDPRAWRRFLKHRGGPVGGILVVLLLLLAMLGPSLAPHSPTQRFPSTLADARGLPLGPGDADGNHPLGGDPLYRDVQSRLLHGGAVSMSVAGLATLLAVFIGLMVGLSAGLFGGAVDTALMRFVDIVLSMPFLLIAIVLQKVWASGSPPGLLLQVLGDERAADAWEALAAPPFSADHRRTLFSVFLISLILGTLSWTTIARVVRAKTLELRERDFVLAARAQGMSTARIARVHILPNLAGPLIALATLLIARMVLAESALSFLGLGVQAPTPTWGGLINDATNGLLFLQLPSLLYVPAALIVVTVFGFNLLGEGLRDAFDPKG